MKRILGLDLGTNSVGWSLIEHEFSSKKGKIIGMGSRIIPMGLDKINDFSSGNSVSQTADRTHYRSMRRLRERHLLRRERLHRVLNILGFLPEHYKRDILWEHNPGQFLSDSEPKLAYSDGEFIFLSSYNEMIEDFRNSQPGLLSDGKRIPYDWTIYYLRKKALTQKISGSELAWILLHFNKKRGYYQLRGEDEDKANNKREEHYELKVREVVEDPDSKGWYNVHLENGWIYRRKSKTPLTDWVGKDKEFIVSYEVDESGSIKTDAEGNEKRSFRAPKEDDWGLLKVKTEKIIDQKEQTVGEYIYETLLANPDQKIRGKLIRTIERKYYHEELKKILITQKNYHSELTSKDLYEKCIADLYQLNQAYRNSINSRDFIYLLLDDILFYQRPLKSKKSAIAKCRFETRVYIDDNGDKVVKGINGIPASHPLFQEFRVWQWIQNLRLFQREGFEEDQPVTDHPVTEKYLSSSADIEKLFDFLMEKKEIKQKSLLKYFGLSDKEYRWNYVDDSNKAYPCNETRYLLKTNLSTVKNIPADFLTSNKEYELWHLIYSIVDKNEYFKALKTFSDKNNLDSSFQDIFKKAPVFERDYGAYSEKALRKILPLMRCGNHWSESDIDDKTRDRIEKLLNGEFDTNISDRVREKIVGFRQISDFCYLPIWLATYIIYDRHSEETNIRHWRVSVDLLKYISEDFKQYSLRNPIVEQVVNETLKVVADVWEEYGEGREHYFDEIHVELARDLKNNAETRQRISRRQMDEENTNHRLKSLLMELADDSSIEDIRPNSPYQLEILKIYEEGSNNWRELPADIQKISASPAPSKTELVKYRAWLEQGYRSPYTGEVIPLSRLFTHEYQIEHVIPQARYFDDSFSNKVICESEINKLKDKSLGFEFIQEHGGEKVELGKGSYSKVFSPDEYVEFIKRQYANNPSKRKKLLLAEIPEEMIQRQINDTRYISRHIIGLLSNIVREEGEIEHRTSRLVPCTGKVTSELKSNWGLNDVWNDLISPRFMRMNEMITGDSEKGPFGYYKSDNGKRFFFPTVPFEYQKGFKKKRIDHRHHALDALVVACASVNHVNYLNNESHASKHLKGEEKIRKRYDLRNKLMKIEDKRIFDVKTGQEKVIKAANGFLLPWETFTLDAKKHLEIICVSHKQNLRIVNKSTNKYQKFVQQPDGSYKKSMVKQVRGDNWSIRKPMHKETVYGKVKIDEGKEVSRNKAFEHPDLIINRKLGKMIESQILKGVTDPGSIVKNIKDEGFDVPAKIRVFTAGTASRVDLDTSFDQKKIEKKVTDSGIRKILMNHLNTEKYQLKAKQGEHNVKPEELAFSPEGIEDMNRNITELNDGEPHKPIKKVRVWESGSRFPVGHSGNKGSKFVEAAKGTNLFFSVYVSDNGKRVYESVPLNEVIEHQKLSAEAKLKENHPVPVKPEMGRFLFSLSPNDLVYVPTDEERDNPGSVDFNELSRAQIQRVYKMASCTGTECYFLQNSVAQPIIRYDGQRKLGEFGSLNKMEKTLEGEIIKEKCWKISVDRLGIINRIIRD